MERDKEGPNLMIKRSIWEDVTIINIYATNRGAPQYFRQILRSFKVEINSNTIIVGDFNTTLTPMDTSVKQKSSKETQVLSHTMDQLDITGIYKAFHPKTINFTFFSSAHKMYSRIDHKLAQQSSLGKKQTNKKTHTHTQTNKKKHFKHLFWS